MNLVFEKDDGFEFLAISDFWLKKVIVGEMEESISLACRHEDDDYIDVDDEEYILEDISALQYDDDYYFDDDQFIFKKDYNDFLSKDNELAFKDVQCSFDHPDVVCIRSGEQVLPNDPAFQQKIDKLHKKLRKYELPESQDGEDSDTDSDIDSIEGTWVPTKNHWLKTCLDIWGMEKEEDVISKVKAGEHVFEIFTDGVFSEDGNSGCGAILRDGFHRPIVAESKVIPKGKCVSPFLLQLEGIALGVKLAKKYKVGLFYLYCPSEEVCHFVNKSWSCVGICRCSDTPVAVESQCETCLKKLMCTDDRKKGFNLIQDILSELQCLGVPWFNASVSSGSGERNEAAHFLAEVREDKELKLSEIGEREELWGIIYVEVFGHYFE
ncbi:hypothetical protein MKW94_020861 [Papaver nudicaule]|uniref:Uncharacterized protein n=1 Tax=Papaver nudicaule TaxID=74823 RepID=A0AA41VYL7_PAPNU|nr:hypothetical protein [Papaver nudicaule]